MQQKVSLKVLPSEAANEAVIKKLLARSSARKENEIKGFQILKRSIDARGKTVWINLTVNAFINEPFHSKKIQHFHFRDVSKALKKVIIIGAGMQNFEKEIAKTLMWSGAATIIFLLIFGFVEFIKRD